MGLYQPPDLPVQCKAFNTFLAAALATGLVPFALSLGAFAQQPPVVQPKAIAPDPRVLAAQQAFEVLPETERRAIQQDLSFTTSFNGAALGTFGSLTFAGIQTFERDNGLIVDGILTAQERQLLSKKASNARRALNFSTLEDQRTGSKIGIPQSIFTKRDVNLFGGSRWQSADSMATLDTTTIPSGGETLQQLFEKAIAPTSSGRKITYKLLRPDFFVVAGETPSGKFYRRLANASDGKMNGFSISYSKAMAPDMDKLVIAIANTFEPSPTIRTSISSIATSVDSTSQRHGSGPGLPVFVPSPAPPGPSRVPERRGRLASALILDPTTVLTSDTAVKNCRAIAVGSPGVDGRVFATNSTTGLAMVKTNGLDVRPFGLISEKRIDQPLVIVTQAWSGSVPTGVFSEATLLGPKNLTAPLQPGGTGGALFDAKGELVGMVVDDPSGRKIVAGIVPAARYQFAVAEDIAAFLQEHSVPVPKLNQPFSDKNIAGARRHAVVSLVCDPL